MMMLRFPKKKTHRKTGGSIIIANYWKDIVRNKKLMDFLLSISTVFRILVEGKYKYYRKRQSNNTITSSAWNKSKKELTVYSHTAHNEREKNQTRIITQTNLVFFQWWMNTVMLALFSLFLYRFHVVSLSFWLPGLKHHIRQNQNWKIEKKKIKETIEGECVWNNNNKLLWMDVSSQLRGFQLYTIWVNKVTTGRKYTNLNQQHEQAFFSLSDMFWWT